MMKFRRSLPLKFILFFTFGLVAGLPLLFFGVSQAITWRNEQIRLTTTKGNFRARILSKQAGNVIKIRRQALETLAPELANEKNLNSPKHTKLLSRFRKNFGLKTIHLLDLSGVAVLSEPEKKADGTKAAGTNYSDREYFQDLRRTEKTVISNAILGRVSGVVTIQVVVPIKDIKGRMIGALSSGLDIDEITAMATELLKDEKEARLIIMDDNFRVLTQAGGTAVPKLSQWKSAELLKPLVEGQSLSLHETDEVGVEYYGAALKARETDFNFYVIFSRPYSVIMDKAKSASLQAAAFIGMAMVFALLISYYLSVQLAGPVSRLAKEVKAIGSWHTETQQEEGRKYSFDFYEIKALTLSFKRMRSRLIRQTTDLENRVEQRTEDLIQLNHELEIQRAKNQYAGKMAALGEMAAGVAHEINNPLAVIAGRTFLLKKMADSGIVQLAKVEESADSIDKTVSRIAKIIQALRFFSHEGSNDEMVSIETSRILEDTVELCRQRFNESQTELKIAPVPANLLIECRGAQIAQVILNLLNNSFDAVQNRQEKWVLLEASKQDDHLVISVTDSGSGIPADLHEKIMQPFFTTKPVGQGTGLGLSVSQGIVNAHGGSLQLDATSARTRFILRLPLHQAKAKQALAS